MHIVVKLSVECHFVVMYACLRAHAPLAIVPQPHPPSLGHTRASTFVFLRNFD